MLRYKMNHSDLVGYWNKYVGAWGGKAMTYTFKGYKDGKVVKECEIGPSTKYDLEVNVNKNVLTNEDTYDVSEIRLRHIDEHKSLLDYSSRIVNISVEGPIELIGSNTQALLGGQLTLYIKSKNKNGPAKVTLKMDDITEVINLEVRSR